VAGRRNVRGAAGRRWPQWARTGVVGRTTGGLVPLTRRRARKEARLFDLTGKLALVTGASGGLGGAIARALHAQGASVALSGTRREALEAVAGELGARTFVLPCDLADKQAVEALVPAAEAALGGLDILVNNAGVTRDNLFMRMKDEEWDQVLAVNLTAAFRLSRACLKGMMRRRYGRIIGITSVVGVTGNPGQGNYAAPRPASSACRKRWRPRSPAARSPSIASRPASSPVR